MRASLPVVSVAEDRPGRAPLPSRRRDVGRWATPRRSLEREVLAHAVRGAGRQERVRDRQVTDERPVELVPSDPRRDPAGSNAFGRHDELAALRQRQPLGVEARRSVRLSVRREQRRHVEELDVAVVQPPVRHVDVEGVEPRRLQHALVVGQAVEDVAGLVVGDARQPADCRRLERRPGRDDRLAEKLDLGRLGPVARARRDTDRRDDGDRDGDGESSAWTHRTLLPGSLGREPQTTRP